MKKWIGWIGLILIVGWVAMYLVSIRHIPPLIPTPYLIFVTATPIPAQIVVDTSLKSGKGPVVIAIAQRDEAAPTPTTISPQWTYDKPTPLPDYIPGRGMAVLMGESPYTLSILPGGWQAYQIGPSANLWGYLVDITPLAPGLDGANIEHKILPEFDGNQWVDVLWLRVPVIVDPLEVRVDLIPTLEWKRAYQAEALLSPGDWMGFAMFVNEEGCGGVLDITLTDSQDLYPGAFIANTRVQPEFPSQWLQVARVQLDSDSTSQQARLDYYTPGSLAQEVLKFEATLEPGVWSGWGVMDSQAHQGYIVEVIPLENKDNEVERALVQPEFNGISWQDVLRIMVPQGRPPLKVLVRVLAVAAP